MALKPCRECGAQVSTEAEICPHCGIRSPTASAASEGVPRNSAKEGDLFDWRRLAIFLFLASLAIWWFGKSDVPRTSNQSANTNDGAAVPPVSSAQTSDLSSAQSDGNRNLPDIRVCQFALDRTQSEWDKDRSYSDFVTEASKRGLTVDACRQLLASPSPSQKPSPPSTQKPLAATETEHYSSAYRDKDGFVTIFDPARATVVIFKSTADAMRAVDYAKANPNMKVYEVMELIGCIVDNGTRAIVEGGSDLRGIEVTIAEGPSRGCKGVVPVRGLKKPQ